MAEMQKDPEVFRLQYEAARALFENDPQGCIAATKHNLVDPTLPPYYVIKNCILMVCTLEDWREADIFRLTAESVYHKTLAEATSEHDQESLDLLRGLAEDLETLNQYRNEDMYELTGIGFDGAHNDGMDNVDDGEVDEEMDDKMDVVFPDDYSDVSEDDVQHKASDGTTGDGGAKELVLPVRTQEAPAKAAEAAEPTPPVNANNLAPPVTATMLRRQKSSFSKSGAYHAHEWNRSVGKGGPSPKELREMFEQEQDSQEGKVWPKTVDHINTWSTTAIPIHARKRRVINYAFSESALRGAEVFVHANVDRWLELLGLQKEDNDDWTRSIDMADQVTYLVFDILGDLCFGKCFGMKEPDSKLRHVPELMIGFMELVHPIACSPISSLYVWLKPRGLDRLLAAATPPAIEKWTEFVDECLSKRTSKQRQLEEKPKPEADVRKDFFHWLFNAKDPETGTGYSLPELYAECELLTIAGSDTTAIVISAAYFYLSRSLEVQEKLAREILSTFSSYDEIKSGPQLQSCKYLTAFLHEAMRMSPPVPAEPSREVLPGGTTVSGHYFPQGSLVSTAFWAMHYNKDYYPSPLEFRPERWIVDEAGSTAESVALAESAFCAFSSGSRGCVGKNMAWLETRIVLAKTLWKYEIKQDPVNKLGGGSADGRPGRREEGQYQTYEMFVSNRKGPMVQLKERCD